MQEFERSKNINATAESVFEFVSNLDNLPRYLPTVKHAEFASGERIHMQGEAGGKPYDDTGFFRVNRGQRRMEWSSDNDSGYAGWLEVADAGKRASVATVHLSFDPQNKALQEMDKHNGDREQAVNDAIEKALQAIKDLCEDAGKMQSAEQR